MSMTITPQAKPSAAMTAAMESRESQQVQVAMLAAKRFPRDEKAALDRILNSCSREGLASQSQYSFARGGTDIGGPSIRLAEAIAQHWGNIECGWREVERTKDTDGTGVSVVEAYAWDMESNFRIPRSFTVRHWRDRKNGGGYALSDERDIYELCANQAARRLRACILGVIPGDIVEEAVKQCDATLASSADTGPESQKKIVEAFAPYQVTRSQIEAKIQRRISAITAAQVITLRKIMMSLKDGMSSPADWFEPEKAGTGEVIDPFKQAEPPAPAPQTAVEIAAAMKAAAGQPDHPVETTHENIGSLPLAPWGDETPRTLAEAVKERKSAAQAAANETPSMI